MYPLILYLGSFQDSAKPGNRAIRPRPTDMNPPVRTLFTTPMMKLPSRPIGACNSHSSDFGQMPPDFAVSSQLTLVSQPSLLSERPVTVLFSIFRDSPDSSGNRRSSGVQIMLCDLSCLRPSLPRTKPQKAYASSPVLACPTGFAPLVVLLYPPRSANCLCPWCR